MTRLCKVCRKRRDESLMAWYEPDVCQECNLTRFTGTGSRLYTPLDSDTAGYAGWNNGLGETVRDRGHFKELIKRNNYRELS